MFGIFAALLLSFGHAASLRNPWESAQAPILTQSSERGNDAKAITVCVVIASAKIAIMEQNGEPDKVDAGERWGCLLQDRPGCFIAAHLWSFQELLTSRVPTTP